MTRLIEAAGIAVAACLVIVLVLNALDILRAFPWY